MYGEARPSTIGTEQTLAHRQNRNLIRAAAPRTSTITASGGIEASAQFHTMYVSWSTTSAIECSQKTNVFAASRTRVAKVQLGWRRIRRAQA